jgi:large subunit ribosomal protein L25
MATMIKALERATRGKGGARQTRFAGRVPAIMYGAVKQPMPISVAEKELTFLLSTEGESGLIDVQVANESGAPVLSQKAVIRAVDYDPLSDRPIHVDFMAVAMDRKLTISVPVQLVGDSVGVVRNKGLMAQIGHEIEVECLPGNIPHAITVDVSNLDIGQSIHVGDLPAMEGVEILTGAEQVIVIIEAPKAEETPAAEVEAAVTAAEPEVITKRKEEEAE